MSNRESRITSHGFFITGTDTGVGKTLVACALLHALSARGSRVVGMKPVAAGARKHAGRLINDDVEALAAASTISAPADEVNPYCFEPAVAPHIAASKAGVRIDLGRLREAYSALARRADCVIIEGAGGFLVPLGADFNTADLAADLALPVILVVGMRLGCINHALLTADAIRGTGLPIAGWVANHIDPHMDCATENVDTIDSRMGAPLLARIPYSAKIDAVRIARELNVQPLYSSGPV
ncbi:MAG: Dethiobiotin synthetase [Betaproteobacteria bacterium]|jgi:dethiobiotin synthetase|nr:Dethiobiotin synthetase [Betaproteobacteria bacterium]MEA3158223.1 dethiobiotin synthetase [Betaproteobacteria bacterium]